MHALDYANETEWLQGKVSFSFLWIWLEPWRNQAVFSICHNCFCWIATFSWIKTKFAMHDIFELCAYLSTTLKWASSINFLSGDTSLISFWGKECYICTTKVELITKNSRCEMSFSRKRAFTSSHGKFIFSSCPEMAVIWLTPTSIWPPRHAFSLHAHPVHSQVEQLGQCVRRGWDLDPVFCRVELSVLMVDHSSGDFRQHIEQMMRAMVFFNNFNQLLVVKEK